MAKRKKKKSATSATYKSFFVVIIALFIIWGAVYLNGNFKIVKKDGTEELTTLNFTSVSMEKLAEVPTTTVIPSSSEWVEENTEEIITTTLAPSTTLEETTSALEGGEFEGYSNKAISWSFQRNTNHSPVVGYNEGVDLAKFDAHYIGDSSTKRVYLTFDEGYENGFTASILDTLAKNDVKAAFFVTKAYVDSAPELVKRMKDEGHIVANHSATHPNMTTKTDEEIYEELESTRVAMEKASGYKMDMYFRPPAGGFSEHTLQITKELGYTTMFWSMAYQDWLVDAQPGKEAAYKHVMDNVHPGALILLHAVSQSNAEALGDVILDLKAEGYSFGTIDEIK